MHLHLGLNASSWFWAMVKEASSMPGLPLASAKREQPNAFTHSYRPASFSLPSLCLGKYTHWLGTCRITHAQIWKKIQLWNKHLEQRKALFVNGLSADVKEPDAEYLSPDSIYLARCTAYLNSHLVSPFHLLPCRATDGSSVPQYCANILFPWLLELTLIQPNLLELVMHLYDAFKQRICDKTRINVPLQRG